MTRHPTDLQLSGYLPGAIGRIVELHARYYHTRWGFGLFFESKVATELSDFLCRFQEGRDGFWIANSGGEIAGSIAIDAIHADTRGAHLRWFIVAPENHGKGIGGRLLGEAVDFCRERKVPRIFLWTFEGLHPARHLYEKFGFTLCEQQEGTQWGKVVIEQRFELRLK